MVVVDAAAPRGEGHVRPANECVCTEDTFALTLAVSNFRVCVLRSTQFEVVDVIALC